MTHCDSPRRWTGNSCHLMCRSTPNGDEYEGHVYALSPLAPVPLGMRSDAEMCPNAAPLYCRNSIPEGGVGVEVAAEFSTPETAIRTPSLGWLIDRHIADPLGLFSAPTTSTADRKSTRLNSSHVKISYAVYCVKKKNSVG